MKEALLYTKVNGEVRCGLCWHGCTIKPGRRGLCGVRENRDGTLYSLVYGQVAAEHVDPVEKKPLFHFLPGSLTYSLATVGCNFSCLHCQNHSLSQVDTSRPLPVFGKLDPAAIAARAAESGCASISYTYSEPTIFFEFAGDCCRAARSRGLKNIFVSNGYMSTEAAELMADLIDAINIDVKAFSEKFYHDVCRGSLQRVLDNVALFKRRGVWVEVTTLIIPGLNDTDEELRRLAGFLADCSPDIVWHVSGFHPTFRMLDRPPTPVERLISARSIGYEAGLRHVYTGNIRGSGGEDTVCPGCGTVLIGRHGYSLGQVCLDAGRCRDCSYPVAGVWD